MQVFSLETKTREEVGRKVNNLREQGLIPAVIYGKERKSLNLAVNAVAFLKIYKAAGESSLIDLKVDNAAPVKVLIQDTQIDPVSGHFIHVDFQQIRMDKKLTIDIELNFVGEAPGVKELGGILVKNLHTIKVDVLPKDLVNKIDVDITTLKTFANVLLVKDIKFPAGIEVKEAKELGLIVAKVIPPISEEELKAMEEKPEEKVGEVKLAEGEQPEEGAEASAKATADKPAGEDKKAESKKEEKPAKK